MSYKLIFILKFSDFFSFDISRNLVEYEKQEIIWRLDHLSSIGSRFFRVIHCFLWHPPEIRWLTWQILWSIFYTGAFIEIQRLNDLPWTSQECVDISQGKCQSAGIALQDTLCAREAFQSSHPASEKGLPGQATHLPPPPH